MNYKASSGRLRTVLGKFVYPIPLESKEKNCAPAVLFIVLGVLSAFNSWRGVQDIDDFSVSITLLSLGSVLPALMFFCAGSILWTNRGSLTLGSMASGFRATTVAFSFYAIWILLTGTVPSKYNHARIPRADSIQWFIAAAAAFLLGEGAFAFRRWRRTAGA